MCQRLLLFDLRCDDASTTGVLPEIVFTKISETKYDVRIDLKQKKEPFVIVLSEDFHSSWSLKIKGQKDGMTHIGINGYANGWIVDPQKLGNDTVIEGSIQLGFQRYYTYGWIVSGATCGVLIVYGIILVMKKRYEKS